MSTPSIDVQGRASHFKCICCNGKHIHELRAGSRGKVDAIPYSECFLFRKYNLKSAKNRDYVQNYPIKCIIKGCNECVLRLSMENHLTIKHANWFDSNSLPHQFQTSIDSRRLMYEHLQNIKSKTGSTYKSLIQLKFQQNEIVSKSKNKADQKCSLKRTRLIFENNTKTVSTASNSNTESKRKKPKI